MAPYKVALIPPKGDRLDLVIPFDGSKTFSDLTSTVMQRASKYRSLPSSIRHDCLRLSLGSDDGYMIEPDDIIKDIMNNSSDVLFIIFLDGPAKDTLLNGDGFSAITGAVQIRIITPNLAQWTLELRHIPLLQNGRYYKPSTSLGEIRHDVAQHLRLPAIPPEEPAVSECNCKLAELLVKRGEWDKFSCNDHSSIGCFFASSDMSPSALCARCSKPVNAHNSATKVDDCQSYILRRTDLPCGHVIHSQCLNFESEYDCPSTCYATKPLYSSFHGHVLVVSGNGHIEKLELSTKSHSVLMARLSDRFGENFTDTKSVFCKGGLEDGSSYSRMPVVAVCASDRHRPHGSTSTSYQGPSCVKLDLHTVEGPINTPNLDLTMQYARLADIAVNGVLNLYAVEWRFNGDVKKGKGKDAMFTAASHWKLPSVQSDRGMAAFLASLRAFSHIIGSEDFDDYRQNEVLRILHALTRFPPAVRAAHILMDGKTLRPNESAALVQSIAAVAEELIPLNLISNDMRRSLEGARLIFGLILHGVRAPEGRQHDTTEAPGATLPYITGYQTVDLRDAKTIEAVTDPVLTNLGLVNKSVLDAFTVSALLKYSPSSYLTDCSQDDFKRVRVALLYGGVASEAPHYEADMLGAALERYAAVQFHSLNLKSLSSDIPFLASLCEETRLVAVAPRHLSNAKAPSLTLDRHGNMAVYTGRAACAAPGHDHAVFHPLTGVEENVDVTIISQMLEPILKARERDGTNVFDLFSASFRRKESLPTEVVVFCVDCSHSMEKSSGFPEMNDEDDTSGLGSDDDIVLDDEDDTDIPLNEIKSWLRDHESYEDILHIIQHSLYDPQEVADEILDFVRTLIIRELAHLASKQRKLSQWATSVYSRTSSTERRMSSLQRTLTGLNLHEEALRDFLVFAAKDPSFTSKDIGWSYGDPLPSTANISYRDTKDLSDFCIVPQEYLCPISQVVFEDPVNTVDGFTFDRKAIERWYRIRNSSPLTGLPVEDTTLRHHQSLADQIKAWSKAEDVIESLPSSPKRTRVSTRRSRTVIDFIAPTVHFTREVPGLATLLDLHKIAFRGMRGLYTTFDLYMGGVHLPCTGENSTEKGVVGKKTITISPNHIPQSEGSRVLTTQNQMCLVRVYTDGDRTEEAFNYWLPSHSEHTFGSILFRHWRYQIQHCGLDDCDYDRSPWTDLKDGGDGVAVGWRKDTWCSLSDHVRNLSRVTVQEHEALYERLRDCGSLSNVSSRTASDTIQYDRCRVLKVELLGYESADDIVRRESRKAKCLSRMAVTKQVFSQFINRLIAYNFPTNVGLITFGTRARISQKVTDVIENFRQAVDRMDEEGDTAVWDALALAVDHLEDISRPYPKIKKRIICLSDGEDTSSLRSAEDVCRTLLQHKIVVDSVCIGNEDNRALRTISYLTGGYKFVPTSVEEASALCELEPVLSIHERPSVSRPMSGSIFEFSVARSSPMTKPDPVTRDEYPARKTHENLNGTFIQIGHFERTRVSRAPELPDSSTSSIWSRRLLQEIRDIAIHPHPSYDVYVSERNMGFWKVVLQGPGGSAYASGAFVLYLDMGEDYPRKAPGGRFVTPIFHPNVNRHGRICHSIFDRNWTVDTTNKQILDTVFGLLLVPEFTDPINTVVTLNYYWDEVAFTEEVQKHIQKHAKQSRTELGHSIMMANYGA